MGAPKGNQNAKGHGAPKGNKNAVGFGAPYGNKNAMKHGLYCPFWVYIPPTHENLVVLEAMQAEMNRETFNAYKKRMHKEVREALQRATDKCNGKRYVAKKRYNRHTGFVTVEYICRDDNEPDED